MGQSPFFHALPDSAAASDNDSGPSPNIWTSPFGKTDTRAAETAPGNEQAKAPHQRFSSPFGRTSVETPPPEKPNENSRLATEQHKPNSIDRVKDTISLAGAVPNEARDANARALAALALVQEGQPLPPAVKEQFESALRDAGKIDAAKAAEQEQKLTEELLSKSRTLNDGRVLPPWTEAKEREFQAHIAAVQRSFVELPGVNQERIRAIELQLRSTSDISRRLQLQAALRAEATMQNDPGGKVAAWLLKKQQLDTFTLNNVDGLVRRNLHQQEMAALHAKAIVSGLFALALEKSGSTDQRSRIETLTREAISDKFAVSNLPEILRLKEKYGVLEHDPIDARVPGRAALKRALEIMQDQTQGNARERLKKAAPFFEQAIGASDEIDLAKTDDKLKQIAKEAAGLNEASDKQRLDELDKQAVQLLETIKQPGLARLAYAMTLNNIAVSPPGPFDKEMNDRALAYLRAIEKKDPGARFDPVVQGAIKLASETPPRAIKEDQAIEVGRPLVERFKKEAEEQGKPQELPYWRKALGTVADLLIGMAAWYAVSRLIRAGREGPLRNWQTARRLNSVEIESTPSLKAGEKPRLVLKDADGKEREVTGVRKEDGSLRVKDGEKTELVKLQRGDKLVLKVAPDSNLTPEQARAAAAAALTPTRTEQAVDEAKAQTAEVEAKLRQRDIELAETRKALEHTRSGAGGASANSANPKPGDRIEYRGENYSVAGERGAQTILHRPESGDAAVAEPISEPDLKSQFEEVKVQIDGKEEIRYANKANPEKGLHRVTEAAGSKFIAADPSLTLVRPEQLRAAPPAPASSASQAPASTSAPEARTAPERQAPERGPAPGAGRLEGTELIFGEDGTLRRDAVRVGELLSAERLRGQKELTAEQVRTLETEVERLKKSDKVEERQRGAELEQTVRALKGEYGTETRAGAHKEIIESARRELETRSGGRAIAIGSAVGAAILISAGLAYYLSQQRVPQSPLVRSKVTGK